VTHITLQQKAVNKSEENIAFLPNYWIPSFKNWASTLAAHLAHISEAQNTKLFSGMKRAVTY
jgi:hypothetical protein